MDARFYAVEIQEASLKRGNSVDRQYGLIDTLYIDPFEIDLILSLDSKISPEIHLYKSKDNVAGLARLYVSQFNGECHREELSLTSDKSSASQFSLSFNSPFDRILDDGGKTFYKVKPISKEDRSQFDNNVLELLAGSR